jgi:hypothetical protein
MDIAPITPGLISPMPSDPKHKIWRWVGLVILLLVVIGLAGGYFVVLRGQTAWGEQLQDQTWQHFVDGVGQQAATGSYALTYTDSGTFKFTPSELLGVFEPGLSPEDAAEADKYAFTLDGLKLGVALGGYYNFTNLKNPKLNGQVSGSLANNGKNYTAATEVKIQDYSGFIKYDYNEAVRNIALLFDGDSSPVDQHKGQWVKFADSEHKQDIEDFSQILSNSNAEKSNPYREILRNNRPFTIKSFQGFSLVNKQPVAHYELALDKEALRRIAGQMNEENLRNSGLPEEDRQKLTEFTNKVNDIFLDKLQMQQFEVWVGLRDRQVYRSIIVSNAISVTKTADLVYKKFVSPNGNNPISEALESAQRRARDAKRLADIRQLASALELYFNDNNSYPEAKNGQPVGLVPTYIGVLPTSPVPAEGPCDDYHNTYWYEAPGPAPHTTYSYSFCLSADTGGLPAGNRQMTQNGMDSGSPTSTSYQPDNEVDDWLDKAEAALLEGLQQLPWDAELRLETTVEDYSQDKQIDLPTDFVDPAKEDSYIGL